MIEDESCCGGENHLADDSAAFLEHRSTVLSPNVHEVRFAALPIRRARSLVRLNHQLDLAWPMRSRRTDGYEGDRAHCPNADGTGDSDHCPNIIHNDERIVTAFDATQDLANGCDMESVTEGIRLSRDPRVKYVIWNRRIFSSTVSPWIWRAYSGENPHTTHAHFSVLNDPSYFDAESDWQIRS